MRQEHEAFQLFTAQQLFDMMATCPDTGGFK
jgi:hypothetical protein